MAACSELDKQVTAARSKNEELKQRNAKLEPEVEDLKNGTEAVEERARFELGMVKKDEIFVQILEPGSKVETKSATNTKNNLPKISAHELAPSSTFLKFLFHYVFHAYGPTVFSSHKASG